MILAVTNQKGGVGKTTTVMNIGAFLAKKKKKVLLVDLDPQANLSSGLVDKETQTSTATIYDLLVNKAEAADIIRPTRLENLKIIPSGIELAGAEVEMVSALSRENILKRALEKISKDFDFVLIDCPPSLGLLTVNGLVAAEKVLIPVQSEYYALEGLGQLINTIKMIKGSLNPNLDIGGVILTMYDSRTNLSKDVEAELKNYFEDKLFSSIIPRSIRLSEAPSRSLTVAEYAPDSTGAIAYENLAKEIINRFEGSDDMLRPNLGKD
jgi:chromosome partitioning protein